MMFWSRGLTEAEQAFVARFFGSALQRLQPRLRLYQRRVGDTRRALSLNGGRISMPRQCFEGGNPRATLRLHCPCVAGLFSHELLHQWQRLQGVKVTRQALWLQTQALCLGRDPYAYPVCATPQAMLSCFLSGQVEQQGQIWEDYVCACVAGVHDPVMVMMDEVSAYIRGVASQRC